MFIAIRKESNGNLYFDVNFFKRFTDVDLKTYNFKKVEIPQMVDINKVYSTDFNDDLTFNIVKYQSRLRKEEINFKIEELNTKLKKLDYIGTKIATGRGTREEYAKEIELMTFYANEINNLEKELTQLS